ncbi:hypothetical protein [Paraburkholderia humisilvae]|uniref:Alkaline phosphatase L n=1 Tax=Paraburkholderia humisilvae TaxID=627669 RepID=A0A6J5F4D0_9BURK|nr:hypothetical protein [Paraburkholderia humisilvae]CAB3772452.1 Alkaline phosphatase L [Paraburkholderia humisilvae]
MAQSGAAVGYLSPAYTNAFLAPSSSPAKANKLPVASLRNAATRTDLVPTFQNAALAAGTVAAPTTLVRARVQTNWVPIVSNPTLGYPISGTSEIILSQCYANPSATSSIVNFLNTHYHSNAALIHGYGFDVVPATFLSEIGNDFLSDTHGFRLNIGNAVVCTGPVQGR